MSHYSLTSTMLLGLGLARLSPLPQRCNFLKINIITNCYILNWNLYLSIENQWIRWILFLLLGCRKFGAPLWRSSCKISHRGIFQDLCAYRRAIRPNIMNSSLVVLSIGQIMTYLMFPECDQISLRETKNPFKFTPPANLWHHSSVGSTKRPLLWAFNCPVFLSWLLNQPNKSY